MERHEELATSVSQSEAGDSTGSELRLIGTICSGGSCPGLFRTNRGTLIVQGFAVAASEAGLSLSAGESLVEIPEELFAQFAASRQVQRVDSAS